MIKSFGNRATEDLYHGRSTRQVRSIPNDIHRVALRKLDKLHNATTLQTLRYPPANRLEALKGDMVGLHSLRVNDQYRLTFRWQEGNAYDVAIVDYHD